MADDKEKLSAKPQVDTTDFKSGISAMNRELRVLESGFRASAASMGNWADDASGLELRIKSLNSQIDVQRQKVAATRAEYERIKAEKGETSKAAQDLEIKLNKETETLGKMENELNDTESALQDVTSGEEDAAQAADDLGNEVQDSSSKMERFQGVLGTIGTIAAGVVTALAAVAAAALAAAAGIAKVVFDAAETAGQLVDMSTKTGISTTRLQELQYAADQTGSSLDTITGSQARLIRSMESAREQQEKYDEQLAKGVMEDEINVPVEMAAAFNQLGVSVTDANGNLRDNEAVFADVIDRLGQVENETERDALAMQIFGKSAQELNPLIKAGSKELARLSQEAHDVGAVMAEEDVAGLEAFGDTMTSIQAGIQGLLGKLAVQFLPVFETVSQAMQELFKSDDFKRGIEQISKAIQGFVQVTVDVLQKLLSGDTRGALATMFGADRADQLIGFFTTINNFIQNTLVPFLQQHGPQILAVIKGLAAGLAAFTIISTVVGWITGLIATVTSLAGVFTAAGGGIAGVVAILGGPVTLVIAAIAAAIALLAAAWQGNWFGIRDAVSTVWDGYLKPAFEAIRNWLATNIPLAIQALSQYWTGTLLPAIQAVWAFLQNYIFPLFRAIGQFISAVFSLYLRVLAGIWQNVLLPALQKIYQYLANNVFPIFRQIGDFISKTFQPIIERLGNWIKNSLVPAFAGIVNAIKSVITWLTTMADKLDNLELPDWLTPGSPTPWEIGLIGINKAMEDLNNQLPVMARNLEMQAAGSVPGISPRGSGSGEGMVQNDNFSFYAPVILQGSTPAGSLGARLKGRRY